MSSFKTGDLLLVRPSDQNFSKLIAASTKQLKTNYTHIALIVQTATGTFCYDASPKHGCRKQTLTAFSQDEDADIDLYRLKQPIHHPEQLTQRAQACLGTPYNASFWAKQPGYYCSEFVCEVFAPLHYFHLTPMTFGPNGTILPDWQEYYNQLGLPIPNGEPGSSPNSLVAQGQLRFIQTLPSVL